MNARKLFINCVGYHIPRQERIMQKNVFMSMNNAKNSALDLKNAKDSKRCPVGSIHNFKDPVKNKHVLSRRSIVLMQLMFSPSMQSRPLKVFFWPLGAGAQQYPREGSAGEGFECDTNRK